MDKYVVVYQMVKYDTVGAGEGETGINYMNQPCHNNDVE